jgi:PKD repeat protein
VGAIAQLVFGLGLVKRLEVKDMRKKRYFIGRQMLLSLLVVFFMLAVSSFGSNLFVQNAKSEIADGTIWDGDTSYSWLMGGYPYVTVGMLFETNEEITIDELGVYRYAYYADTYYNLRLWDASSESLLRSVDWPIIPDNTWTWFSIAPITVPPGEYVVSVGIYYYFQAGDDNPGTTPDGVIEPLGWVRASGQYSYPSEFMPHPIVPYVDIHYTYDTSPPTLYAGGSNPGVVYKYNGGTSWDVISPELGYAVLDLVEYEGRLYAATMSTSSPLIGVGRVYRYDGGTTWTLVGDNMDNQVASLSVYQGNLYAGTSWNGGNLYRYDGGTSWTVGSIAGWSGIRATYEWSDGDLHLGDIGYDKLGRYDGSSFYYDVNLYGSCIYDFESYGGYLYASAYQGALHRSSDGINWVTTLGYYDGNMWELETYNDLLHMSYNNGQLRASDGTTLGTLVYTAPDGIISMTADESNLYFGTGGEAGAYYGSELSGTASVYKYDGTTVSLISGVDEMVTGVQVLYQVSNLAPFADADPDQIVLEGETVNFDGSGSSDSDGTIVSYDWDFDDTNSGSGIAPTHSYDTAGTYTVTLTVTDDDGATDSDIVIITVLSSEQATQDLIEEIEEIIDNNPGTPLAEKMQDALDKLNEALEELSKEPPENQAAVEEIERSMEEIEDAVTAELLDLDEGTELMDLLVRIARQLAVNAIEDAIDRGGDPEKIEEAQDYLEEGDDLRASGLSGNLEDFAKAVDKYKDALSKTDSA